MTVSSKRHHGKEQEEWRMGEDVEKIEWKLPEINARPMSRGENELIREFKMAQMV